MSPGDGKLARDRYERQLGRGGGELLSVIVPARDEAANLRRLLDDVDRALAATGRPWELIVVDDASTDATWSILTALAADDSRLRPIRLTRPSGQTGALLAGFRAARGTLLATLDGDLQCRADSLTTLLAALDGADLACGVRRGRQDSLERRIMSVTSNVMRRVFLAPHIRDLACPARVFRRDALDKVEAMTPLFDGAHRWLPALFHLAGLRVVQRAVAHEPRTVGHSKYTTRDRIRPVAREVMVVLRLAIARSRGLRVAGTLMLGGLLLLPFFVGLGAWPLLEPDEGRNAEVAREMLALGQWSVPHFDLLPYLDKPVLLFWAIGGAFWTFGVSEFSARLPSAVSAAATIALTGVLGRRLLGIRGGVIASVVVATAPLMLAFGRLVIFDMLLTALVTAALACLVEARMRGDARGWWPLAGAMMGLATLAKGPVGIALPLVAWAAGRGALPSRRQSASALPALLAVLAVVVLVVPWLVRAETDQPGFLRYAIFDETLLRLTSPSRFNRAGPPWYYLAMLTWVLGVWGVLLVAVAPELLRTRRERTREASAAAFAARAAAAMIVFFTLSASKRAGYLLPAMVPLALLVAAGMIAAPRAVLRGLRVAGIAMVVLGAVAMAAGFHGASREAEGVPVITPSLLASAGVFAAVWGIGASTVGARRFWPTVIMCAVFIPGLGIALHGPLRAYAEARSARPIADRIPPGATVVSFRAFRTGLPFYLKRPVVLVSDDARELTSNYVVAMRGRLGTESESLRPVAALANVVNQPGPVYVVTSDGGMAELRAAARRKLTRVYVHGRARLVRAGE